MKKPVAKRVSRKVSAKARPAKKRPTLAERLAELERRVDVLETDVPPRRVSESALDLIGTWKGDDLPELRKLLYATRGRARF